MERKAETEDLESFIIKVPKNLGRFLRFLDEAFGLPLDDYLTSAVIQAVEADMDALDSALFRKERIIKRFGLEETLNLPNPED
jgi:hypothetical protein